MKEDRITLPDGRKLGYALYGSPDGWPVLYLRGTPSSRLEPGLLYAYNVDVEQCLVQAGLRLIAIDRPGMGLSSYHPGSSFLSVASDASALLRALSIDRCSVLSWSGGGPFAMALAWKYPLMVKDLYHICTFSRCFEEQVLRRMTTNKWYFLSARHLPGLLRFAMNRLRKTHNRHSVPQWISGLADPDYKLIRDPADLEALAGLTFKEACRTDARGPVHEAGLYFKDFGFDLADIQQPLHFWWGTDDRVVVRLHAEAAERRLNNNVMHYKAAEGHLSIYVHYFNEVLKTISSNTKV